ETDCGPYAFDLEPDYKANDHLNPEQHCLRLLRDGAGRFALTSQSTLVFQGKTLWMYSQQ
ncbi:MAG: hypothetical protein AAB276_00330, partial [Pseudomonadota bacterium]